MKPFNSYKHFLQEKFGCRVQKLTIDAGFSCPNRDGTKGLEGCTFCTNEAFNPSYCTPSKSVHQQLDEGILFHQKRYRHAESYLAYFQAYSNTYQSLDHLKKIYQPALDHPNIVGLIVGTRPDCIDEEKLDYFAALNEKMFISIEYGVESIHNSTLIHINRGHDFETAVDAITKTKKWKIHTGAHFIFGLPFETPDMWMNDIEIINKLPIDSIKFHQLQIIKGTNIEKEFNQFPDRFHIFDVQNYIPFIVNFVERISPSIIIERFAGEVPPRFLALNSWGNRRYDVILQEIEKEFERRGTYQGIFYQG